MHELHFGVMEADDNAKENCISQRDCHLETTGRLNDVARKEAGFSKERSPKMSMYQQQKDWGRGIGYCATRRFSPFIPFLKNTATFFPLTETFAKTEGESFQWEEETCSKNTTFVKIRGSYV